MRRRVKVLSMALLQPIQLAAMAISTAFQKRRAPCQGMSAFIRAPISTNGTCTIVLRVRSSVPKAKRAPVQIDPIDSPFRRCDNFTLKATEEDEHDEEDCAAPDAAMPALRRMRDDRWRHRGADCDRGSPGGRGGRGDRRSGAPLGR